MAFGDVGGAVVQLVITCRTRPDGPISIRKGDPLRLAGEYQVVSDFGNGASLRIFGEALSSSEHPGEAIPVKVRGISIFRYVQGSGPMIGESVKGCDFEEGFVEGCSRHHSDGAGTVLKVDEAAKQVHVLL